MTGDESVKRRFSVENGTDAQDGVFTGKTPKQAAIKAARRFESAPSEAEATSQFLRIREHGTDKIHIYKVKVWVEETTPDTPDWLDEEITEVSISKEAITY